MKLRLILMILIVVLVAAPAHTSATAAKPSTHYQCQPTEEDEMGPFYRPGAALRSQIGSGYLLTGAVKSAETCAPIPSPLIEFWQAGPDSRYVDDYRAAIITGPDGIYRLETNAPPAYVTRPPHIHIRVSAKGFKTLVTQHYLQPGDPEAVFELVLVPL